MPAEKKIFGYLERGGVGPGWKALAAEVALAAKRDANARVIGFRRGFRGLLGEDCENLTRFGDERLEGMKTDLGSLVGSSRDKMDKGERHKAKNVLERHEIDALIMVGGDGSAKQALKMHEDGIPVVFAPGTIDRDIAHTDMSLGFRSAVDEGVGAIRMMRAQAQAMGGVGMVKHMGRAAGWITREAALEGKADIAVLPEEHHRPECDAILERIRELLGQRDHLVVSVAEGYPEIDRLVELIAKIKDVRVRLQEIGYAQCFRQPVEADRALGEALARKAVELANEGRYGTMASVRNGEVVPVPLSEVVEGGRILVPAELYDPAVLLPVPAPRSDIEAVFRNRKR